MSDPIPARDTSPSLLSAAWLLSLFAAGSILAAPLHLPIPGAGGGLLLVLLALRIGVMAAATSDEPGAPALEGRSRGGVRLGALHASHL